jgi:DNA-binding beta-propeller fold protein YncE
MKGIVSLVGLGILGSVATLAACGGQTPAPTSAPQATQAGGQGAQSCARVRPGTGATRFSLERQSNPVSLAKHGNRTIAYVADEDSKAIHTVDVDGAKEIASTKLPGSPSQILVLEDGRVAVTLRDKASIAVLEPAAAADRPLELRCSVQTPAEPIALAATPDDATLLVTTSWDQKVVAFDAAQLTKKFAVDVEREPRAIVVDDKGERAFVSHAVGAKLTVVDLTGKNDARNVDLRVKKSTPRAKDDTLRTGAQGYALAKAITESPKNGGELNGKLPTGKAPAAPKSPKPDPKGQPVPMDKAMPAGRIFVPMVTIDPGNPDVQSQAYYGPAPDGVPKEAPVVSVVDPSAERSLTKTKISLGTPLTQECLLPRSAAFRASTGSLFVACAGIDSVLELDTRGVDPIRLERRRFNVPSGPMGLAIDDAKGRAVVWSQFEGVVSVIDLSKDGGAVGLVQVSYDPSPEVVELATGRQLFHLTDDQRISNDGVACASCHPEGREDALTWATPEGPRQTIMLAGRATTTAPYGWVGKHGDLKSYVKNTFTRLGGRGLDTPELSALITYLERVPGPNAPSNADGDLLERGKELFYAEQQGCASCHVGAIGVDKTVHDVGSRARADNDVKFDTPSLKFIKGTAPYFHDGRYDSLDAMLSATDSEMGHTAHLSQRDRQAIKVFLETL